MFATRYEPSVEMLLILLRIKAFEDVVVMEERVFESETKYSSFENENRAFELFVLF